MDGPRLLSGGVKVEIFGCLAIWYDMIWSAAVSTIDMKYLLICCHSVQDSPLDAHKICYVYLYIFWNVTVGRYASKHQCKSTRGLICTMQRKFNTSSLEHLLATQSTLNACGTYFCRRQPNNWGKWNVQAGKIWSFKILIRIIVSSHIMILMILSMIHHWPLPSHVPFFYSLCPDNLPL